MSDKKIVSWRRLEITQQVDRGFTLDVCKRIMNEFGRVDECLYICHDKDNDENVHCSIWLKLIDSTPTDHIIKTVNKFAGCECIGYEQLQKIKGSWKDVCAYATHANAPLKYQYSDSEVYANFNWQYYRDQAIRIIKDDRLQKFINDIKDGSLTRFNYQDRLSIEEYVKYHLKLEKAFKINDDKKRSAIKDDSEFQVIYIQGKSSYGKTTLAKDICIKRGFTYCISSSDNDFLQDYKGQDAFIVDDCRPDTFGSLSNIIKMLDHNTRSSVHSRYNNKFLFCKLIIITSIMEIDEFYEALYKCEQDHKKELLRRVDLLFKMTNFIRLYRYDYEKETFIHICSYENTYLRYNKLHEYNDKALVEEFNSLLSIPVEVPALPGYEWQEAVDVPEEFLNEPEYILRNAYKGKNKIYRYDITCPLCNTMFSGVASLKDNRFPDKDNCPKCKKIIRYPDKMKRGEL